jgi:ornithine carbamoyltransferase
MLADLLTIEEQFGSLAGRKLTYMGDARYNMGNSLMIACTKMGMHFTACAPAEYFPNEKLVKQCEGYANASGGSITLTEDVKAGTDNADVLYTDVWVSMGEPDSVWEERIKALSPYQINRDVMENANENAVFMHCLPAFHDLKTTIGKEIYEKYGLTEMEVTDEVFEKYADVVFREAENRMHTIKAVMYATL